MAEQISEQELQVWERNFCLHDMKRLIAAYRAQAKEIERLQNTALFHEFATLNLKYEGAFKAIEMLRKEIGRLQVRDTRLVADNPFPGGGTAQTPSQRITELEQAVIKLNNFDAPAEVQKLRAELRQARATISTLQELYDNFRTVAESRGKSLDTLHLQIKDAQTTIAHQGAVIAAMRREIETLAYEDVETDKGVISYCIYCKEMQPGHHEGCEVESILAHTAQLAADHDAAVRAPLEEKIGELSQTVDYFAGFLNELPCCHEPGTHKDTPPMMWPELIRCIIARAIKDAKGDERQKVLDMLAKEKEAIGHFDEADRIRTLAAPPEEDDNG